MHNAECRTQPKMFTLYVQHAECRMQEAESSPKWILLHGAGCRMQNAGCKIRPKEFVRRVQLTALSPISHPASASCILHRVLRHPALGPILHSAFCICILHRVQFTALGPILHSAFCICILHDVMCGARAQKAEIWHDSYSRGQITHDHLLRCANGATRPGFRTQQPPAGPREQRVSSGELS